jgi:colanic acid biosynthesis glycosyl transferase WcaI
LSGRLKRFDATICYVPTTLGLLALALTSPFRRGRLTAVVHDIESGLAANVGIASSRLLVGAMRAVERIALGGADSIVVLTDAMQDEIRALGVKRPLQVIPIWATVGNEPKHDAECAPTVLYSGNFGKKQNLDQLLPLIGRLAERRPDVKVVLRGDGSERARLQAAVAAMGVTNTSFGPLVPAAELADSLGQATVHLVPQAPNVANYTLPSKLISVMAAGRPFVSIAAPGSTLDRLAESSGAGLCVGPDSGDALFEAVLGLVDNPERATQMGANGRRYVLKNMNQDDILDRYAALITL